MVVYIDLPVSTKTDWEGGVDPKKIILFQRLVLLSG